MWFPTPRHFITGMASLVLFASSVVFSQDPSIHKEPVTTTRTKAGRTAWTPPRTSWGDPDFQGIWTDIGDYLTPFERPVAIGTRTLLTDEEYAKKLAEANADNEAQGHIYFDTLNGKPSRRTSLIIDPADGRMPPYTPEGKRRVEAAAEARRNDNIKEPATILAFGVGERCITRTLTGAGAPRAYNNERQIFQTKDNVAILYEEIHDARIISIDGRPHLNSRIRDWMGDSRGHWEGNTLVIEATNFRDRMTFNGSPGTQNDIPISDQARIIERFTRIDADTIHYTTTVDDPGTFTKPWTFEIELKRDPTQTQILEFGCHEGNKAIEIGLESARADEAKAQKAKAASSAESGK